MKYVDNKNYMNVFIQCATANHKDVGKCLSNIACEAHGWIGIDILWKHSFEGYMMEMLIAKYLHKYKH